MKLREMELIAQKAINREIKALRSEESGEMQRGQNITSKSQNIMKVLD